MPINSFLYPGPTNSNPYVIDNSCRFNRTDSPKMSKTLGTPSDADKWTFSAWVKLTDFGTDRFILSLYTDDNNETAINFENGNSINFYNYISGSYAGRLVPNQKLRDPAAWYHLVAVFDSGNGTAGNRMRLYLNGSEITSFATDSNPNQDQDSKNASGVTCVVGRAGTDDYNFGGYMAEVCFCDGQAYAASDFGEFDSDSPRIWKPKDVSGLTFGNNGFYLDFEDSSNLGNDANGGTDLTEANLAATDQATDTPTNNFATFNPLVKGNVATTLSEGNLKGVFGSGWSWLPATFGVQNGKWYWEAKVSATNDANVFIGITTEDQDWDDSTPYDEAGTILYFADGRKSVDGTDTESHFASYTTNDIIGVALDLDSGTRTITFYKNNSVTPASSSAVTITSNFDNKFIMPVFVGNSSSAAANWELNFGSPPYANSSDAADENGYGAFEYSPPSGYLALCTKNLGSDGG